VITASAAAATNSPEKAAMLTRSDNEPDTEFAVVFMPDSIIRFFNLPGH
jgi:hypothetical protein